jgi:hypothetical protein
MNSHIGWPSHSSSVVLPQLSWAVLLSVPIISSQATAISNPTSSPIPTSKALPPSLSKERALLPTELALYCRQAPDREWRSGAGEMAPEALPGPVPIATARWWQDLGTGHWLTAAASQWRRRAPKKQRLQRESWLYSSGGPRAERSHRLVRSAAWRRAGAIPIELRPPGAQCRFTAGARRDLASSGTSATCYAFCHDMARCHS